MYNEFNCIDGKQTRLPGSIILNSTIVMISVAARKSIEFRKQTTHFEQITRYINMQTVCFIYGGSRCDCLS